MTAVVVVVAVFAYIGCLALALLWVAGGRRGEREAALAPMTPERRARFMAYRPEDAER